MNSKARTRFIHMFQSIRGNFSAKTLKNRDWHIRVRSGFKETPEILGISKQKQYVMIEE